MWTMFVNALETVWNWILSMLQIPGNFIINLALSHIPTVDGGSGAWSVITYGINAANDWCALSVGLTFISSWISLRTVMFGIKSCSAVDSLMAQIEFTSSPSGSGKSYYRCARFLADQWLPHQEGVHFSNFPVKIDPLVAFVLSKHPDLVEKTLRDRVHIIPQEVLDSWRSQESGPWNYFPQFDVVGGHIAIDEIHNFCNKSFKLAYIQQWQQWVGEVRHTGCTVEFLTQHETKVHPAIRNEATLRRSLMNGGDRRDPYFKVLLSDWYNLRAKYFTGKYVATVYGMEEVQVLGRWKQNHSFRFILNQPYFGFYDSYSAPVSGKGKGAADKKYDFETKSKFGLLKWFLARNWIHILPRIFIVCLLLWSVTHGKLLLESFMGLMRSNMPKGNAAASVDGKGDSIAVAGVDLGHSVPGGRPGANHLVDELQKQVEDLKKQLDDMKISLGHQSDIVLINDKYIMLRSGQTYSLGETIGSGIYQGRTIKGISSEKHRVTLDNGTILYIDR